MAPTPLFFELSCEVAWPVPEEVNNGFLTMILNVPIVIFLSILMVPGIGTSWMNWFALGSVVVSVPVMVFIKEQCARLDQHIDDNRDIHNASESNIQC